MAGSGDLSSTFRKGRTPTVEEEEMRKFVATLALAVFAAGAAHAADLGGKLLKVGSDTTSPPMESVDPASGQIVGFDVDVVNAICAKINCQAEFVTIDFPSPAKARGKLLFEGDDIADHVTGALERFDIHPNE